MSLTVERGSPAEKAAAYLKRNPAFILGRADLAGVAGVPIADADEAVTPAVRAGLITVAAGQGGNRVWRAGRNLSTWAAPAVHRSGSTVSEPIQCPPDPEPEVKPKRAPRRGGERVRHAVLDVSQLQVITGMPLPVNHGNIKGAGKYDELFALLTGPGQCVPGIPAGYKAALQKAAIVHDKRSPFGDGTVLLVRLISGTDTCGVWREVPPPGTKRKVQV